MLVETLLGALGRPLVLIFVFRSFMAIVPLLMAAVAIPTTFLLIWPIANVTDVSVIVQFLVALIGLGIAIDYALLVVVRWREEREAERSQTRPPSAMRCGTPAPLSSSAAPPLRSRCSSLLALPMPALRSIGIAGLLIALVSVAVANTLLPVVLATVGPWLDRPRSNRDQSASRAWSAWARIVVRHRWIAAGASTAVLAALISRPRRSSSATRRPTRSRRRARSRRPRAAEDRRTRHRAAVPVRSPRPIRQPRDVAATIAKIDGIQTTVAPSDWRRDGTAIVTIIPSKDANSRPAVTRSTRSAPPTIAGVTVGGEAAQSADFLDAVYGNFPLMILAISVLTFILLARAFRSLILPLKAVLLNLLSVAAAWGLTVLVWQDGYGSNAIWNIPATQAINVEMPIVIFAFLFGISMDYQVFIISRMREAYDRTGSTETAVVEGIGRTGRLVTSAALIMFLAFVAFSATPGTEAKMFATALGGGILIDATIIRGVLAPPPSPPRPLELVAPHWAARLLRVAPSEITREPQGRARNAAHLARPKCRARTTSPGLSPSRPSRSSRSRPAPRRQQP
jgi:RND superfamily putative drug exporter